MSNANISHSEIKAEDPKVFVSYAHESPAHKQWVLKLATDLRDNGVNAILDVWECTFGVDLLSFMERGIAESSRVLLICTPTYKSKSDARATGVAYERLVVTGELARNIDTNKFICALRLGDAADLIPHYASSRLYADFRNDPEYHDRLEDLLRDIYRVPALPKPPLGSNPFIKQTRSPASSVPIRRKLPDTRQSKTHKFNVAGSEGFITVGLYEDGSPGEVFITIAKGGSTISGLVDSLGTSISIALQYGVPLNSICNKFAHQRFEPAGMTSNTQIPYAKSIVDYIFRWLFIEFVDGSSGDATSVEKNKS